jgi:hypothetical protein
MEDRQELLEAVRKVWDAIDTLRGTEEVLTRHVKATKTDKLSYCDGEDDEAQINQSIEILYRFVIDAMSYEDEAATVVDYLENGGE